MFAVVIIKHLFVFVNLFRIKRKSFASEYILFHFISIKHPSMASLPLFFYFPETLGEMPDTAENVSADF